MVNKSSKTVKKTDKKTPEKALKVAAGVATAAGVVALLLKNKDKIRAYLDNITNVNTNIDKALIYKNQQLIEPPVVTSNTQSPIVPTSVPEPVKQPLLNTTPSSPLPIQIVINNYTDGRKDEPEQSLLQETFIPPPEKTQSQCIIM